MKNGRNFNRKAEGIGRGTYNHNTFYTCEKFSKKI